MKVVLAVLCVTLCLLHTTSAVFFYLESSERCFFEEVEKDTLVVGHYNVRNMDDARANYDESARYGRAPPAGSDSHQLAITVAVRDPSGRVLFAQKGDESHRFAFTSHTAGIHTICVRPTTGGSWFSGSKKVAVDFDLDIGEMALDFKEIIRSEHFSELEGKIFKLKHAVHDVMQNQAYLKKREERFRNTTASTHSQALFWSLLQITVMILSSAAQMYCFKSSFASSRRYFLGW